MDTATLHRRCVEHWDARVDAVTEGQWSDVTPCTEWDVRALVNHVVGEELWTVPLLEGARLEEVGDRFDGDVLGDDPVSRSHRAAAEAMAAADGVPDERPVHLSYGDESAGEYLHQLAADHLVHGWDLAAATGGDTTLDPELVAEVARWFADKGDAYRAAGIVGPHVAASGDPQTDLLAAFGREAGWSRAS